MDLLIDDIRLDLPATNKYLNVLGACLNGFCARIDDVEDARITAYNVELAVNEIFANIVAHAYGDRPGGRVEVRLQLAPAPRRLVVQLFDTGLAFDPEQVAEPDLEDVQLHGYGLFLARSLLDDVDYTRQPDGNQWRLTKHL